jgi:hypothetical protein
VSSLIKRLSREVFKHHSNPWSAWTRLLSVPLVFVPISGPAAGDEVPSSACG